MNLKDLETFDIMEQTGITRVYLRGGKWFCEIDYHDANFVGDTPKEAILKAYEWKKNNER